MYLCKVWSLTLIEERRLRVSENRMLRIIFGLKRDGVTGNGENYIMRSNYFYFSLNIVGVINERGWVFSKYMGGELPPLGSLTSWRTWRHLVVKSGNV